MEFRHIPVMYREVLEGLDVKADGVYVDCTLGGAGHSQGILEKLNTSGRLVANDLDEEALENGRKVLAEYSDKVTFVHGDYKDLPAKLDELGIGEIDGVLIDLGVSSPQIDNAERGFSYIKNAPLDMRMDRTQALDARAVVNGYPREELTRVIREYGEDKLAAKIAAAIVREREREPIETTERLAAIVENSTITFLLPNHTIKLSHIILLSILQEDETLLQKIVHQITLCLGEKILLRLLYDKLRIMCLEQTVRNLLIPVKAPAGFAVIFVKLDIERSEIFNIFIFRQMVFLIIWFEDYLAEQEPGNILFPFILLK